MNNSIKQKNPILKIILNIISWTILTLLVLIALFLVYYVISAQTYASKGEEFKPQFSLYTIISGSMEPTIKVYDVVFDTKVESDADLKVGDVITFTSTSSLTYGTTITHRIMEVVEDESGIQYRTKGDNNITPDSSYTDVNHILGKVVFKIPMLGRLQFLLLKAGGWLFVILIPSLGIVIYDIIKIAKLGATKKRVIETLKEDNEHNELMHKKQEKLKSRIKSKLNKNDISNINEELPKKASDESTKISNNLSEIALTKINENFGNVDTIIKNKAKEKLNKNKILKNVQKYDNSIESDDDTTDDIDLPKIK